MNTQTKKLNSMIEAVEVCNKYFTNHVGTHDNDYIRKVCTIVVIVASVVLLLV